ncbi:MAG: hypothetical protein AB1467_00985 [Candidatus Diapherotrites archaeon]
MRLYLDSNIIISYINLDFGRNYELMYKRVEDFFALCAKRKFTLIISSLTINEVNKNSFCAEEDLIELLKRHGVRFGIIRMANSIEKREPELRLLGIHFPDSLHVAYALESKSDFIVTWNKKDFEPIKHLIDVISPDEVENHVPLDAH